ncbi:SitI3 family protein [Streptomyces sp. NPDC090053]|uniref:SitI3 family protein n=1 Tax=Streptomyces sp. NPDC090053 TaxID=3365932 RepID=UPI00382A31FD
MAIAYNLDMATPSSVGEVAAELKEIAEDAGLFLPSPSSDFLMEEGVNTRRGTWVHVMPVRPESWNPVVTDLGFTPTASVVFRLARDVESCDQQDDMIRMVSPLLERVTGDAVLHRDFETIWLLRRSGDLSLNEREDIWPPRRLALMSQPYRRATFAME